MAARKRVTKKAVTRGERNCLWIETNCVIPEGKGVGQPVVLRPWQRKEVCRIYDNPHGTRRAILSFGRKNAKTALSSFLLLLHLCGPEARPNSQLYSAAQSREQAALLFNYAAKCVRLSATLQPYVDVRDTAKQIFCKELGTLYRAMSAEASTAYGLNPCFIVHDELGQVKGPRSELYEALETATGAQVAPLSIIISTQAPTDADLLSTLIDDALEGKDPRTVLSLYTSDPEADPFAEETIRQANPAFGDFMNSAEVLAMAEDARRLPSREAAYRNLVLNQRVEAHSPFVSRAVWKGCGVEKLDAFEGLPIYAGLDLSDTTDLTALVLVSLKSGRMQVRPTFWLPRDGLAERSRQDRVPYDDWHKRGFLTATPGRSIEYEYVAEHLRAVFDQLDVRALAFDRWNFKHLRPWLVRVGFSEKEIEAKFVEFGQGYQSMSPALRELENALLNGHVQHDNHPIMDVCAANAVVQMDPAGNRKLTKQKSRGRIDGMVALTMAVSMAATGAGSAKAPEFQMIIV